MKRNLLFTGLLVTSILFFSACKKDVSNNNAAEPETSTKVNNWLERQKSINDPEKNAKIQLLKDNLDFTQLRFEDINRGEKFIIIPVKDGIKSSLNTDKNHIFNLVLMLDKSGSIRNGNLVQYIPDNNQGKEIPLNLFNKFYNHKKIEENFRLTYLTVTDRPLFEFNYQNDKIKGYSVAEKKTVGNGSGKVQDACIEYYWNTYVNGILVSSEYLGTFCTPEVEEGGGSGGGGGGGGTTESIDFSSSETEEDPEDAGYAPPITYTHNFTYLPLLQ